MIKALSCLTLALGLVSVAAQQPHPKPRPIVCPQLSTPIIKKVKPIYPKEAREKKITGKVVLEVEINRMGEPKKITVKSGPPIFIDPSLEAVRQWRWKPLKLNGKTVEVDTVVTVNFELTHAKTIPGEESFAE